VSTEQRIPADETGYSTLFNISKAGRFNEWMFRSIAPYVKGKTLEIGSGIGTISSIFISHQLPLCLSDYDEEYYRLLLTKFAPEPAIKEIYRIDLADQAFTTTHNGLLGTFDTIFALNVIEHIPNDRLAIENCHKLLAPGGRLILLMPSYPALYNRFDKELGHHRRYTSRSMHQLLSPLFQVTKIKHFNLAGILGWFLFGTLFHRKMIGKRQMHTFDTWVPLFRLADRLTGNKIGLSVIGIGEKQAARS
jgi:SAM-dependent methyltransferase